MPAALSFKPYQWRSSMQLSTLLSVAGWMYFAVSLSSGAATQISSDKPSTQHQAVSQVREWRVKQQLTARVRQILRQKANSGLVAVLLGVSESDGSDLFKVSQLFAALERDDFLRIFQVEGKGALQNVVELAFARGIDAGLIQSDTLAFLKREPLFPQMESFLQYVAKLYDKEVHVLAAANIHSIEDLAEKKVNFGPRNSESFMTGTKVFGSLSINAEPMELAHTLALEKLKQGEIAAMVYVAAKPAELFQHLRPEDNLRFLAIPAGTDIKPGYTRARLGPDDYPQSIESGKAVETLAVGSILVVYNWPPGTDRYRKVSRLVETLLDQLKSMRTPVHHPKWRDMDINSPVPGWTRFAPAEEWIKAHAEYERGEIRRQASVPQNSLATAQWPADKVEKLPMNAAEANNLFKDFQRHVQQQALMTRTARRSLEISGELAGLFRDFLQYEKQESVRVGSGRPVDPAQLSDVFGE